MSSQARYLSAGARERVQAQLVAFAGKIPTTKLNGDERDALSGSIVAGLVSCTWWQDADARAPALAALLQRLETEATDVFQKNSRFVLRICDTLPRNMARHFWRVRELMRRRTRL